MKTVPDRVARSLIAVLVSTLGYAGGVATVEAAPAVGGGQVQLSRPVDAVTGRVTGVLKDETGGAIAGGRIEVRAADSNVVKMTNTDRLGRYLVDGLPAGRYRVAVVVPGFKRLVRDGVVVEARLASVVDLVVSIASQEASVVVTAPPADDPFAIQTDPRAPRQPIPAHDGADYLKAIPGFSVIRKGGADGDPVLRGLAGSRLGILLDGQQILGGCGGRMDPPTAYVYPAAYDRITVLKGPQTVLYAAGASAGTVLFERDLARMSSPGVALSGAFTAGAFGRHDELADARLASRTLYLQAVATRSHTDDYADGNGVAVHSFYTRWSGNAAFGWTPDASTKLEVSLARSNGQAAYADRAMDGSRFARDNVAVRFERQFSSSIVQRVQVQSYYNYINHVMDNFSLRRPGATFTAMNPDRATTGGRLSTTLAFRGSTSLVVGGDTQHNVHTGRTAMGKSSASEAVAAYQALPRLEDMRFTQVGVFGEVTEAIAPQSRLVAGLRADWHRALDSRACVATSMCGGSSLLKNNTLGASDRKTLGSGFVRYEHDLGREGLLGRFSIGVGHVERSPDYWERLRQDPVTLKSAFLSTRPEKTTQLDAGIAWRAAAWSGSVSGFYGGVRDYILIRWQPAPTLSRNVDARTIGGEANVAYSIAHDLKADATLALVRSENTTDHKPLAQQPPAEGRIGLTYDNRALSAGVLIRLVGRQNRVDIGSGNIVNNGMDIGPTTGFGIVSANAGYRISKTLLVAAGIDNLFDRAYAEHISQAGAQVPGFVQTTRVNEPGRTIWVKINASVR